MTWLPFYISLLVPWVIYLIRFFFNGIIQKIWDMLPEDVKVTAFFMIPCGLVGIVISIASLK